MRAWKWAVLLGVWSVAVGSGLCAMLRYEMTPATVSAVPEQWPADSSFSPASESPTVVMFVHPRCPCTRASLHELLVLATHSSGKMKAIIVFLNPVGFPHDWEKTDLWKTAASIPGTRCFSDSGGKETARFQARVSGETLVYDATGKLLFHGGITGSRGHEGDNVGRSVIESILAGDMVACRQTQVFGCSLRERNGSIPVGHGPGGP
jgi:hypothetical protein